MLLFLFLFGNSLRFLSKQVPLSRAFVGSTSAVFGVMRLDLAGLRNSPWRSLDWVFHGSPSYQKTTFALDMGEDVVCCTSTFSLACRTYCCQLSKRLYIESEPGQSHDSSFVFSLQNPKKNTCNTDMASPWSRRPGKYVTFGVCPGLHEDHLSSFRKILLGASSDSDGRLVPI